MILMALGVKEGFNIVTSLIFAKATFTITYMFSFMLLLMMMTAIISSHYFEAVQDFNDSKVGLYSNIIISSILGGFKPIPKSEVRKLPKCKLLIYRFKKILYNIDPNNKKDIKIEKKPYKFVLNS